MSLFEWGVAGNAAGGVTMLHVHPRWLRALDPEGSGRWGAPPPGIALQTMEELWHVANPQPQVLACLLRALLLLALLTISHPLHTGMHAHMCTRAPLCQVSIGIAEPAMLIVHMLALPVRLDTMSFHCGNSFMSL